MRSVVDAAQASGVDVAVHLRRRQRAVSKEVLNRSQVGAALQQVRGEGVSESMGMGEDAPQRGRVEPAAAGGEEQRILGAASKARTGVA